ncbi:imidazole glycerol phosphate synthase subunit HisH, partial [bacterium]|nr:imidazole glycerol phosphate synthase subunit HisH [bacterium]
MNIAIVKYNAGNIQSVLYALERIGLSALVTDDAEQIQKADKVIFPGVGEARTAMQYLQERNLDQLIQNLKQPVLGICLGMQLMCAHSEENETTCLG